MFHPQFYWVFYPASVLEIIVLFRINYMRIIVKKHLLLFTLILFMGLSQVGWGQPWNYNLGTNTGSLSTAGVSTTFFPQPDAGNDYARIGSTAGSFNMENQAISFGTSSYIRGVAPTTASINKFSIYDYTAGKSFTLSFKLRLGASDGSSTGAASGTWSLFIGDGANYSDVNAFSGAQAFLGLRWVFGASGAVTTNYRSGSSWSATGLSGTPFTQGTNYLVEIYGNNTTATINYTYGTSQSLAANKFDLWVNGALIGDDLSKALLGADVNIDSYMFYGESSASNVSNIFLDDFYYQNSIADVPLPVELTSFSALTKNKTVSLSWKTATEVNNFGFEIQKSEVRNQNGQKLVL